MVSGKKFHNNEGFTPTGDPLYNTAREVTPSTPQNLDQLDSGDMPATAWWWTSGCAFGR